MSTCFLKFNIFPFVPHIFTRNRTIRLRYSNFYRYTRNVNRENKRDAIVGEPSAKIPDMEMAERD